MTFFDHGQELLPLQDTGRGPLDLLLTNAELLLGLQGQIFGAEVRVNQQRVDCRVCFD